MSKNVRSLVVGIVLTVVLLYFFGRSVAWKEVPAQIVDVRIPLFLLTIPLAAFHFVTRALRWQVLIAREKPDVRFRNLVAANAVGFTVNALVPGRLGELVRPMYLARKEGLRTGFAIGTVVVERIFDAITNCVLLALFMVARPLFSSSWPIGREAGESLVYWGTGGAILAAVLITLTLLIYFFREKAERVFTVLVKPLPAKAGAAVLRVFHGFIEGLEFFRTPSQLGLYFALSLIVWLGITLFYWVFFLAYRVEAPFFMIWPYVFLTAIGASIPTPGMVGGFHYFSKLGMTLVLGIAASRAAGMTMVVHALQIAVTCAVGYGILAREGLTLFQLKRMGESEKR